MDEEISTGEKFHCVMKTVFPIDDNLFIFSFLCLLCICFAFIPKGNFQYRFLFFSPWMKKQLPPIHTLDNDKVISGWSEGQTLAEISNVYSFLRSIHAIQSDAEYPLMKRRPWTGSPSRQKEKVADVSFVQRCLRNIFVLPLLSPYLSLEFHLMRKA